MIIAIENKDGKFNISICGGTGCQASRSEEIKSELERFAKLYGVDDRVSISITGCFGFCEKGPIVKISPDHTFYIKMKPENAERIIKEHIVEGKLIEDFLYTNPASNKKIRSQDNIPSYKKQHRIALRNCGLIDPELIQEYIANRGFLALSKVLSKYSREEVIEEMILDDKEIMWYGQLMRKPQVLAYLLQVDMWLKEYQVMIEY